MSDVIFDLEQKIMQCWSVVEDVQAVYDYVGESSIFEGLTYEQSDKLANLLLGVSSLYDVKFDSLFKTFEDVTREYHDRNDQIEFLKDQLRTAWNERESLDDQDPTNQSVVDEDPPRRSLNDATPAEWDVVSRKHSYGG